MILALNESLPRLTTSVLLRSDALFPHLNPISFTDPVNDEYEPDRVAPV